LLSPLPPTRNHPSGSLPIVAQFNQRPAQSLAARAASTIVSLISQDSVLYEMPNAIWQLESYDVGDKYHTNDISMVEKGWLHIQRMNQKFGAVCRPEHLDLEEAVDFLRGIVQRAATEYLKLVESAIVKYANERFITPVAKTDDEAVDMHSYLDSYNKVVTRIWQSTTEDIHNPLWVNWLHIYQLVRGLWEDRVGNQLTTKTFLYTFLKTYKVKLSDLSRTDRSAVNTAFWDVLKPGRKTYPYQCPFVKRLNYLRHKKIHERIVSNAATHTSLTFMLDHPRSSKLKSKKPFYVWEGKSGKPLFFLFDKGTGETERRKRERTEDAIVSTGRMRMDMIEDNTNMATAEDVKQKARMIRTLLQGVPPKELIHQLFDEYYGRGALNDYVRSRSRCGNDNRERGNNPQPTNEIMCAGGFDDLYTNDPSTLTASWNGEDLPDLFGLNNLRQAASGRAFSFEDDYTPNDVIQESTVTRGEETYKAETKEEEEIEEELKPKALEFEAETQQQKSDDDSWSGDEKSSRSETGVSAVLEPTVKEGVDGSQIVEKIKTADTKANKRYEKLVCEGVANNTELGGGEKEDANEETTSELSEKVIEKEVVETKYDVASYTKQKCVEPRKCPICENKIKNGDFLFECTGCVNEHIVCQECMQDEEDEEFKPNQCQHEEYEDADSYERCVGPTYWWMNKAKPKKNAVVVEKKVNRHRVTRYTIAGGVVYTGYVSVAGRK
jgi:hypothetical protein